MKLKNAAIPIAAGKYSRIIISIFINVVLSRLLTPEDFGVVAVVTVFTTFFASLSDMGLSAAVIQIKELTQKDIDNIYSFSIYYSAFLTIVFAFFSFPIAYFYKSSEFIGICLLLAISLFFDAMNTVPNGILNRNKKFKEIAVRTVSIYSVSAVFAVIFALLGMRYYALVFQNIIASLATFMWNYISTHPRFIFKIEKKSIDKIKSYSSYQFAFNILVYFSRNLDNLLTGKFFGSAELGYYNKAYTLMLYPINNITNVISPVLHPVLSDYQKEKKVIYDHFLKIVKVLFVLGAFISSTCFLSANEIIIIIFGRQWESSIFCFRALSVAILFQMINGTTGAIYQALNNTRQLFINGLVNSVITVLFILGGIFIGKSIFGLSVFVASAYIIQCIISFFLLIKLCFKYSIKGFLLDMKTELGMFVLLMVAIIIFRVQIGNILFSFVAKVMYLIVISFLYLHITHEDKSIMKILR